MNATHVFALVLYFGLLIGLAPLLGAVMARLLDHEVMPSVGWRRRLAGAERVLFRALGMSPDREMTWREYALALLAFNTVGFVALLAQQIFQAYLPLNPSTLPGVPFALAANTAVSFVTNTNWQAYSGESTMSALTQMMGLGVQNFVSAATGLAVLLALARGLSRQQTDLLGNFWVDLVRCTLYVLLPLSLVLALLLAGQGVVQAFQPFPTATTLDGADQVIPLGPVASQIAIKQLGTNGGGYFGGNSSHPFENPTPLSNFIELLAILLLPASCVFLFGRLIRRPRHARALFAVMLVMTLAGLTVALWAEHQPNPSTGLSQNLEGKETRFSVTETVLWATATTVASNGSVNAMHDSFMPLTGLVLIASIMLGEVIFGGVGAGLYGMVLFVLLTVFLAGLMVGRTPEYLGKKIEAREMAWTLAGILIPCAVILSGAALACLTPSALAARANMGPHGLTEILYAFSSAAGNNGSTFAGLGANSDFFNGWLALAMLLGRYGVIIPVLAVAGSLAEKRAAPESVGAFPTEGATFAVLLAGVIVIVGGLNFFPALLLGPGVEHYLMLAGRLF